MSHFFSAIAALPESQRHVLLEYFQEFPELVAQAQRRFETKQMALQNRDGKALKALYDDEREQVTTLLTQHLSL